MSAAPWSSITINVLSLQHRHCSPVVAIWPFGLFLTSCTLLSWDVNYIMFCSHHHTTNTYNLFVFANLIPRQYIHHNDANCAIHAIGPIILPSQVLLQLNRRLLPPPSLTNLILLSASPPK
jgi:hypothetical protein